MLLRVLAALVLALAATVGTWRVAGSSTPVASPPRYLVLIVMDGFREDYLKLAPMHHLHQLMARGRFYHNGWVGQLQSETPASHATLATGVYPSKHGVIGFGWRDAKSGTFTFMPTNLGQIQAGELTQTIEQGGVPTISDLIHARNRHDLAVSVSGEKLWASAPMGTGADYVLYGRMTATKPKEFAPLAVGPNFPPARTHYLSVHKPDGAFDTQDDFAAKLAVKLVDALHPRALLLNLPAIDIAGHYYGGLAHPKDMARVAREADAAIGKVVAEYKKLGILKRTVFVVTADHGMVSGYHRVPIHSIYKAVGHSNISELDEDLQSSIGSIWLHNPAQAQALGKTLAADHFPGVEGALYKVASGNGWKFAAEPSTAAHLPPAVLRAYLHLADTEASSNGADVLLPYAENTVGLQIKKSFKGMHGGFSWGAQHIPLVIAGPGVRKGSSNFPVKLVDITPTMERLIGLKVPAGVDGVVLGDALTGATAADLAAQRAVEPSRMADIHALEAHSAAQSR
ncbi:MAG: alkaline phosphatase family protein [Chloroflexota bacterium]